MAPALFHQKIASHNRRCWIAAFLSLLGAAFGWLLILVLIRAVVLLFDVVRTGNPSLLHPPSWLPPLQWGIVGVLLVWVAIERWRHPYASPSDRSIIGFHLIPEILLAPARMTFAIVDNLSLRISLPRHQRDQAWKLLQLIADRRRLNTSTLGQYFPEPRQLSPLLFALQLTGWVNLHRGEKEWYYTVATEAEPAFRQIESGSQETV